MLSVLLFDCDTKELVQVEKLIREVVALTTDDEMRIDTCDDQEDLVRIMHIRDLMDCGCLDVVWDEGIRIAEKVRRKYPKAGILLIVDRTISPSRYIKPSIMPSSVLIRSSNMTETKKVLMEFISSRLATEFPEGRDDCFLIKTKGNATRIPYRSIYYIESVNKQIRVRLRKEEYSYYDTLENLEGSLPDSFVRCHRSYIVNTGKIVSFSTSDNLIIMQDGLTVPVSRSNKDMIRKVISG